MRLHCHKPNCEHQTESKDQNDELAALEFDGLHVVPFFHQHADETHTPGYILTSLI